MKKSFDPPKRDRWARLRFSVIGPLMASPPEPGRLRDALLILAAKTWRHPDSGRDVRFGVSTLERWYYAARRSDDPLVALRDRLRGDEGRFPSMSEQAVAALTAQYREHSSWTAQLHLDNLRVTLQAAGLPVASYATVRRFLISQGMHRKASPKRATEGAVLARARLEQLEVRSFEVEHVGALLHLDFHHGSRKVLTRGGQWATPMLVGFIDDRSRLVCHLQWYLDETAQTLVHGLSQAFMKRNLPRAVMTDNGSAMVSEEFVCGLARLGIVHQTTLPYSPYQNAKQESFWGRVEGRLMPMLEGEQTLTLDRLNEATQAWVEQEYHRTVHSEIGVTPLSRHLAGPTVARPCPGSAALCDAFHIEVKRRARRSDGTFSLEGCRFEIPGRYRYLNDVHVRYARWDLSRVDLVDPRTGVILCPIKPLDKSANADAQRRKLDPVGRDLSPLPPSGMAPLLRRCCAAAATARRARRHRHAAGVPGYARTRGAEHQRSGPCMNQRLLALYGLKWNPFSPELPTEAIFVPPKLENFCWRIEHAQIREGGFAMIHGDPGTGKSIALRLLAERLSKLCDVTVGAVNHPQSNLADFYRELGDIFAVAPRPHNRWGGFKALRNAGWRTWTPPAGAACCSSMRRRR